MVIYTARCVLPVTSPLIREGAVAVDDGRIVDVGTRQSLLDDHGESAEVRDLGDVVVLPGLINAHTHLELSWLAGEIDEGLDYLGWLRALLEQRESEDETRCVEAAQQAIDNLTARGTVAVGDIANRPWVAPALARSSLFGVQFLEVYGFRGSDAETLLESAVKQLEGMAADGDVAAAKDRFRVILTPHAVHTTSGRLLRALAGRATAANEPLSIHLAESKAELQLLQSGVGPLADLLRERSLWDDEWEVPGKSPVEYLNRLRVLSPCTIAVHCVHVRHQDLAMLQARESTVVTCPRSNERLGVGTAPIPQIMGTGIPVALGTDSLASSPDLDLFAEMAAMLRIHSALAPAAVLRMATFNGARALRLQDRLGSIETGKLAKLTVVPLPAPDANPLEVVCANPEQVYRLDQAPWEAPGS